ncbi:MAG: hypothetical protein KC440_07395 [Nitrosarchaeum sp.]|nr:hypothetical protein [Nitrosarchaeum sp.]
MQQETRLYESPFHNRIMETIQTQRKSQSNWDKMVHAPFKKVVKFDLICMGLGVVMGMGAGAFLVSNI